MFCAGRGEKEWDELAGWFVRVRLHFKIVCVLLPTSCVKIDHFYQDRLRTNA